MNQNNFFRKLWGLIKWSLIRHKFLLPSIIIMQSFMSFMLVYGIALFIGDISDTDAMYLATGTIVINIISTGCVIAVQNILQSKQNGLFEYQKTLPVTRSSILLSEIIIWTVIGLPGIIASIVASMTRFDLQINFSLLSILMLLIVILTMINVGFSITYYFKPQVAVQLTQVIIFGSLMFSPISFPSYRLPNWLVTIQEFFPFLSSANILRGSLFGREGYLTPFNLTITMTWLISTFFLSLFALSRRKL
ncbi:MAG: ABC transporter permease [Defluviitaleaceae bacterium]|nr:ABC transporter permease [Defluviitaleaceae bacterium]